MDPTKIQSPDLYGSLVWPLADAVLQAAGVPPLYCVVGGICQQTLHAHGWQLVWLVGLSWTPHALSLWPQAAPHRLTGCTWGSACWQAGVSPMCCISLHLSTAYSGKDMIHTCKCGSVVAGTPTATPLQVARVDRAP
jgi:hypothetical protein